MILSLLAFSASAAEPTLHWMGIDYGLVRMVGDVPFGSGSTFAKYPEKWNARSMEPDIRSLIRQRTEREVTRGSAELTSIQTTVNPQTVLDRGAYRSSTALLDEAAVLARVASYPAATEGVGLTLIAEQLNRNDVHGCFWVTTFERAARTVLSTERVCGSAVGVGYQNFWFSSVRSTLDRIRPEMLASKPAAGLAPPVEDPALPLASPAEPEASSEAAAPSEPQRVSERLRAERRRSVHDPPPHNVVVQTVPNGDLHIQTDDLDLQISPEALATLQAVVASGALAHPTGRPVVHAPIGRAHQPAQSSAPCKTAYGKTACGYGCVVSYGEVYCAQYPGGSCLSAYGKTECGFDCKEAYGKLKCATYPGGRCEESFGTITCTN